MNKKRTKPVRHKRRPILVGKAETIEPKCSTILTRVILDLDVKESATIRPKCHPEAGMQLRYIKQTGIVAASCTKCGAESVDLQLATDLGVV